MTETEYNNLLATYKDLSEPEKADAIRKIMEYEGVMWDENMPVITLDEAKKEFQ